MKKCLGAPGTPGAFEKSYKNIYKLLQFLALGSQGTPGVFQKLYKNSYKLDSLFRASTTSGKCLRPPGTPGVF